MTTVSFETVNLVFPDCHSQSHITLTKRIPHRHPLVADEHGQLDMLGEVQTTKSNIHTRKTPPHAAKIVHKATHVPFRDWFPFSVASRERCFPCRRDELNKTANILPRFRTDCMFIQTVAETCSAVMISFMCARKVRHEDFTKEILRQFEAFRFLKSVRKIARERNARIVFRFASKTKQLFCRNSARTHSGTRTTIADTRRDEY